MKKMWYYIKQIKMLGKAYCVNSNEFNEFKNLLTENNIKFSQDEKKKWVRAEDSRELNKLIEYYSKLDNRFTPPMYINDDIMDYYIHQLCDKGYLEFMEEEPYEEFKDFLFLSKVEYAFKDACFIVVCVETKQLLWALEELTCKHKTLKGMYEHYENMHEEGGYDSKMWCRKTYEKRQIEKHNYEHDLLNKALDIVDERGKHYGCAIEFFNKWSKSLQCFDINISAEKLCLSMIVMKALRENNNHKEDNLIDIIGYTQILNDIKKKGNPNE